MLECCLIVFVGEFFPVETSEKGLDQVSFPRRSKKFICFAEILAGFLSKY